MSAPATPTPPAPKRRMLLIVAALVIVATAGGGFWWWRQRAHTASAEHGATAPVAAANEHAEADATGALLDLDTFTVNLADPEAARFLRTSVQLVLAADESAVKALEHDKLPLARTRSLVLDLLSQQTSSALSTPDGKLALKGTIAEKTGAVLGHKVSDVLFSDFVIQY